MYGICAFVAVVALWGNVDYVPGVIWKKHSRLAHACSAKFEELKKDVGPAVTP